MNGYHVAYEMLKQRVQCIPLNQFKKPTVEFKNIEITPEFIEQNRNRYQQASAYGVLTRNYWCIDIDVHDKDGFKSIEENPFAEEIELNANKTMIQITPSGGMHLVFKKREGVPYQQKINYLDGVDIKANPNNYFVMGGSVTNNGVYQFNDRRPIEYDGEFEERIFRERGSFIKQIENKYSVRNTLPHYDFSHLDNGGKNGLGKEAYQRIINRRSTERNNDLFLAATYAKQCSVDIEPLKILIGDVKSGDEFTADEWEATVNSASN